MQTLHKLIKNLNIEKYHATKDTWSSSQFKDLLDDPDIFILKYIKKEIPREESAAFDVGTYFHTGTLEPHKLKFECVVFPGKIRRGKVWEIFKEKNKRKAIVTIKQKKQAEGLVQAVKDSKVAQEYLQGSPEISLFIEIAIYDGNIYAPFFKKVLDRHDGWIPGIIPKNAKGVFKFTVKVRADMLGKTYISDLKSTTGNAKSQRSMRGKVSDYEYDLSLGLYLDMFSLVRPILGEPDYVDGIKCCRFIWIFASKDNLAAKTYYGSWKNLLVGRAKYMKAMIRMAELSKAGWKVPDHVGVLEPLPHELEYLVEKDIDLL